MLGIALLKIEIKKRICDVISFEFAYIEMYISPTAITTRITTKSRNDTLNIKLLLLFIASCKYTELTTIANRDIRISMLLIVVTLSFIDSIFLFF